MPMIMHDSRQIQTSQLPFLGLFGMLPIGGLIRRLEKVRAEFSLTALAYNLRRALNILGMEKLMAAVAA